jgi:hypothetical protein
MNKKNHSEAEQLPVKEDFCITKQKIINHYFINKSIENTNEATLSIYYKDSSLLKLLPFTKKRYRTYYLLAKYKGNVLKAKITQEEKAILKALISQ